MSYTTRFRGEIRINPPIPADQTDNTGFGQPGTFGAKDIALKVTEEPVDGVPGAYRRLAVAVVPVMGAYTAYRIVEHTQEIIDRWGDGRTFTGRIDCSGEEAGDVWRLEVHDGRAAEVRPRIVWADDTDEEK
jgi:hypothetical protein